MAALPPPSESAAHGLHGLSDIERYYFETQGFLVVPDIIPGQLLAELNAVSNLYLNAKRTGGLRFISDTSSVSPSIVR